MTICEPWAAASKSAITGKVKHGNQNTKDHKKDKVWYDALGERLAFEKVDGFLEYHNCSSETDFVDLAVEAMSDQLKKREKRKTQESVEKKPKRDVSIGYHLKWIPPQEYQALYWGVDKAQRLELIAFMKKSLIGKLKRFKDAPFLITCHTDTAHVHFEVLILKYRDKRKLPGFKGIYGRDTDQSLKATRAATLGKGMPAEICEWAGYTSYSLTKRLKEKVVNLTHGMKAPDLGRLLGRAEVAFDLLRTLTTDKTIENRAATAKRLADLAPPECESDVELARHHFKSILGESLPVPVQPGNDYLSEVRIRAEKVKERRMRKEIEEPAFDTRNARNYAIAAFARKRKLWGPVDKEKVRDAKRVGRSGISTIQVLPKPEEPLYFCVISNSETRSKSRSTINLSDRELFGEWLMTLGTTAFACHPGQDSYESMLERLARQFNVNRDDILSKNMKKEMDRDLGLEM